MGTKTIVTSGVIYSIKNIETGKIYVGQTIQGMNKRFKQHCNNPKSDIGKDLIKYGADAFLLTEEEVVYEDDKVIRRNTMDVLEKYYIGRYDSYNNGYNNTTGGVLGFENSQACKDKIADKLRGRISPHTKRVLNLNTGEYFATMSSAGLSMGKSVGAITDCITLGFKCGGYWWEKVPVGKSLSQEQREERILRLEENELNRRKTKVQCVETGEIYRSASDASHSIGRTRQGVGRAIRWNRKCGGFTWIAV